MRSRSSSWGRAPAVGPARPAPRSDDGVDVAIGVRVAPPFIMADPIRGRRGLTFELWASIERELRTDGADRPDGSSSTARSAASSRRWPTGELDLVISPLTITAERMERFDFTHQYLSSGMTVAQRSDGAIDFG